MFNLIIEFVRNSRSVHSKHSNEMLLNHIRSGFVAELHAFANQGCHITIDSIYCGGS